MKLRNIFWLIVIGILVFIFAFRITSWSQKSKKVVEDLSIPVEVSYPQYSLIENKITLTGDVKADTEVIAKPKTAGRIEEIFVEEGDYVSKGDKLVSFIPNAKPGDDLYDDMVTFSPISGIVGVKYAKLGEQATPQTSLFGIYDIDNVKVYVDVPEKYYSYVKIGTPIKMALDAIPDRVFSGSVSNIRPVIDPLSRTTQVEISVPNSQHKIKPGMFSKVDIILKKNANALVLPADSVLGMDDKYVYVVSSGKAVKKDVVTGMEEENKVEILSGISSKDLVITAGQRVVENNSTVEVIGK